MKDGFRQSMAWLHTWTGLIAGWVLFFIFLTGTVGYFYLEVDRWMRPELPLRAKPITAANAVVLGEAYLRAHAPDADSWSIVIPGRRDTPHLSVSWRARAPAAVVRAVAGPDYEGEQGAAFDTTVILDTQTGAAQPGVARDTGGGLLLEQMHWGLHYMSVPTAAAIVVVCTMIMLVALVSGVITHKKIFTDFFTFRRDKGQRAWLDIHNVISVTALPFFLMITCSGMIFFLYTLMPLLPKLFYAGEPPLPRPIAAPHEERSGSALPLIPLTQALASGERYFGVAKVSRIDVHFPGDAAARITVIARPGRHLSDEPVLRLDGVKGVVLEAPKWVSPGAVAEVYTVFILLHIGAFAEIFLRWLYFIAGALGCAMIATGLILWTVKRRPKHLKAGRPAFGHQLVERLNVGTIAGLPSAVAIYFWANRLLPADFAARREWESHAMFLAWALLLLYPAMRPVMRAWIEELWLAAALFGLLPLLNVVTTNRHLGVTVVQGDWALAGVDLTALALAVVFWIAANRVRHRAAPVMKSSRAAIERSVPNGSADSGDAFS